MKRTQYLILYNDNDVFFCEATNLCDCIRQLAGYTGDCSALFEKAINGLSETEDFIAMYNHFSSYRIERVYLIDKIIYDKEQLKQGSRE